MAASPAPIELLAPARDALTALEAIRHGADAVYMGAPAFGARAAAANTVADIARVTEEAHRFRAKVYVTLNTLLLDSELQQAAALVRELYDAGVDALIVQDMGLLRLDLPPIDLHASTQADIRTPAKARFLADAGFSQLVLPREFSLREISHVRSLLPADVTLECFVHGALCVSYSGDCQASLLTTGRSANRGCCAQICRLPFDLVDGRGRTVVHSRHLLSLRDMNRLHHLGAMLQAGVGSFKIEGRLKDTAYVKQTVAAYSRALDEIIAANPSRWRRASCGRAEVDFTPDLRTAFNRGFTSYFLTESQPGKGEMATFLTPKSTGVPVATVSAPVRGNRIIVKATAPLSNGDGLGFFAPDGTFRGFRANRVEGSTIIAAAPFGADAPRKGDTLYRNSDAALERTLRGVTARRTIAVDASLSYAAGRLSITLADERGCRVSVSREVCAEPAKASQLSRHREIMAKTAGVTRLEGFTDGCSALFIAPKELTALRREAFAALEQEAARSYRRLQRRPDRAGAFPAPELTYHDNVSNQAAREFYAAHGATASEPALEVARPAGPLRVMTTRYCLRREMGACLREQGAARLPGPLSLISTVRADSAGSVPAGRGLKFDLKFDCAACRMEVYCSGGEGGCDNP